MQPEPPPQPSSLAGFFKRHIFALVVGFLALVAVSVFATYKLAVQPSPASLGHVASAGLLLSIWGLAVSIGGFGLTLWQLQHTETIATKTASVVARMKKDFGSFDVVTEVRTAQAHAEETQGHINGDRWSDALSGYNRMRSSLAKMAAVRDALSEDDAEHARDYISSMLDAATSIEGVISKNIQEIEKDVLTSKLRELEVFLIRIEYGLKDAIRG